jgi:hypothetical protein
MKTIKKILYTLSASCFLPLSTYALNNNSLDDTSTPLLQLGLDYSSTYTALGHGEYANHINADNTAAFLLDFGFDQFRIGLNWAHQMSDDQRFKIGIEHLAQKDNFDFVSGTDHDFIGQNAVGATYQYLFTGRRLQAFTLSSYYADASNDSIANPGMTINGQDFLNIRQMSGAIIQGISFGPTYKIWPGALISTSLNFDSVHYDPQYEPAENSSGFGPTISFIQMLSRASFNASVAQKEPYQLYQAGFNWLAYSEPCSSLEIGINDSYFHTNNSVVESDNVVALNFTFKWGAAASTLTTDPRDLLNWSLTSPANLPAVFVMRDQALVPQ